ncbi:MAG TPA: PP2C family protein-serine/threonine phosphatase [Candidatus Angelobacter sp.]
MLRADALPMALAVVLVSAGVAGILLFSIRSRKRDYTLLLFGMFSGLYGARLFLSLPSQWPRPTSQVLLALPTSFQVHLGREMTFMLPVIGFLFCAQILGDSLRRNRLVWILLVPIPIAIALAGLTCDLFFQRAVTKMLNGQGLFSAGVIAVVAYLLVRDFFRRDRKPNPEMRVLTVGFGAMSIFVVHANLTYFGFPGPNLEAVGFFIFVWALGYVVFLRGVRNEEQLLAVRNELEIARQIQSSILPQELPKIAGVEIAACYAPMKAIGGDFYEFLPVDDKRLGILIADVSGHGVPAALMASMVKVAVFAQMENASRPEQLLSGLNKILCGNLRGQYVTAAYLFLDVESKRLAYAGAGHPPPLLWDRAARTARFLEDNGLMLGLFPEAEYCATELAWNPGDRCLLYTDGVIEAENSQEISFGRDRLENLMKTADGSNPSTLSDRLLDSVAAWRGRSRDDPQDDITIIAVQFLAAGAAQLPG